ncbi:hypothetical protein Goklo_001204 [Gossypium klotzschianum]|uniref:CCHC-type domain-containing protein n=1 Tax=Gossypium klotzschianum TaxID=34286 RepID=A0A7J8W070_9ROSI|nr:hypothetical protein [Gossypium klotzschianum]
MVDFNPLKPFPSMILAWIRFSGLPRFLYKNWVLEEIGSLVRKVAKLDIKTNSGARDQFTMMAVFVDLKKPLTSQVLINERVQRVKFEALPVVCFTCGEYGHLKNLCSFSLTGWSNDDGKGDDSNPVVNEATPATMGETFGPWMAIECKSRPLNPLGKDLMRLEEEKVDIMRLGFRREIF